MIDNTKLNYLSEWDIDQLLFPGEPNEVDNVSLAGNTFTPTNVLLKAYNLSFPAVVDGTFQIVGDTVWRQFGDSTTSGGINLETFILSTPTGVYLTYYNFNSGAIAVNVRYYVWTDKVNY